MALLLHTPLSVDYFLVFYGIVWVASLGMVSFLFFCIDVFGFGMFLRFCGVLGWITVNGLVFYGSDFNYYGSDFNYYGSEN